MSPRFRLIPALAGAAVLLSGLVAAAPAEAASQSKPLLGIARTANENVTTSAAASVTPIKIGRKIDLQVKSGSRWKTVATAKQDQYGVVSFRTKIKRTSKAKDKTGYEWRYVRARARATGSLKERVSATTKVKLLLDPKVYYKVVKASVQHTADASMPANGCGLGVPFVSTKKTDSGLGKAESGKPKWRAVRMADGSIRTELDPGLDTRWHQDLKGCRWFPAAETCSTTRIERPSHDGKERLGVRVSVPRSGSKGSVYFYTRGLSVGFSSADDSVCNVPYMRGGEVPTKIRTKSVSRSTLLGKKPFTVVNQGQTSWNTDAISGKPADLKLRWTESITLQRVDKLGKTLK